ncbi:MAG: ATP-grasp domain-containing protein [Erysipelotrichaceae bacterium]|jgi:hypothetical protein|nr:ATP-grasp domain-containing protein [Erysipelotrichaceae bacterium]
MKNFLFISPNFPDVYYKFITSLKKIGFNVLGIGDSPYWELKEELKNNLTEYYCVPDMTKIDEMIKAINFFKSKYGHIDYLESNNEYWLMNDAYLREKFNIATGQWPSDMDKIKYKSKMKEYFIKAGAKVARYILVSTLEKSLEFIELVNYPVFVKPDVGVGAIDSFKINNEEELKNFHSKTLDTVYIMEEFLEGEIVSFDGIANSYNEVLIALNEHFPIPVASVVSDNLDDFYYATTNIDEDFLNLGKRVIKSFNVKKRCFHIEFFKLSKDHPGLASRGDLVALEVNMRPPGGNTPDLLSVALDRSYYDAYSEIMMNDTLTNPFTINTIIAITASRKDVYKYFYSNEEILTKYKDGITESGRYPKSISAAMGDTYYYAKFYNLNKALDFADDIRKKTAN